MEAPKRITVVCLVTAVACFCQGLESDNKPPEKRFASNTQGLGFGPWTNGQAFPGGSNLQSWKGWDSKRRFGSSGYYNIGSPQLASWKNWMDRKRNFHPEGSFTNIGQMDGSQFQRWSDWFKKRSNFGPSGQNYFGNSNFQNTFGDLQSWSDLAKRSSYFGNGFQDFGNSNGDNQLQMQTWQDWMKRSLGSNAYRPFGRVFGARPNYQSWADLSKDSAQKRQFQGTPSGFGSFRPLFTDGLQDWRSSYKGTKKDDNNANIKEIKN